MNKTDLPHLCIPAGTQFGYCNGRPWKRQSHVLAQSPVDITFDPGLHLLVAPNGAGKTTLMRTLAGLHPALKGHAISTGCIHYVSDELRMDSELTPNRLFNAWFKRESLSKALQLADSFKLNLRCQIGKHSRGNRQKVLLIIAETLAACSGTSLMLLDEPFTGLDAETREIVASHWAATPSILRLAVLHELESVQQANSLVTIAQGNLRQTCERQGNSWVETYQAFRR